MSAIERTKTYADIEARAKALAESARYDTHALAIAETGDKLKARVSAYDKYAAFIQSRNVGIRLEMVRRIRVHVEHRYAFAYNNAADTDYRVTMTRFFDLASDEHGEFANAIQMYIIHMAMLFEPTIVRSLCPPPPDPDDDDAPDLSCVDRFAWTIFEQSCLLQAYLDLRDGNTYDAVTVVEHLDALYTSLLPPNPIDAVILTKNRRRIVFPDDEANRLVADAIRNLRRDFGR